MEKKSRTLYLMKILYDRTDKEHPLTTNQLISVLDEEYGFKTHRTTIASDVTTLQQFGLPIMVIHSTQCKYYIEERGFKLEDVKSIIDAIESLNAISAKKSAELINMMYRFVSKWQVDKLKRNNYIANKGLNNNEKMCDINNAINVAINNNRKTSFQYYDYTGLKRKTLKNYGEIYKISPYNIVWANDHTYVVGFSDKRDMVLSFRIDRISYVPDILDEVAVEQPVDFDIEKYVKSTFNMYRGDLTTVDLRCDNKLMKTIIDKFGEDVEVLAYDMTSFHIIVDVEVSQVFFGWLFGFAGQVQIIGPEEVKEEYKSMILKELSIY